MKRKTTTTGPQQVLAQVPGGYLWLTLTEGAPIYPNEEQARANEPPNPQVEWGQRVAALREELEKRVPGLRWRCAEEMHLGAEVTADVPCTAGCLTLRVEDYGDVGGPHRHYRAVWELFTVNRKHDDRASAVGATVAEALHSLLARGPYAADTAVHRLKRQVAIVRGQMV